MPEVADEPLVRPETVVRSAECSPSTTRPKRRPPGAAREGHVDPVRVLGEVGDPVAEDVLDTVAGVVVEHLRQATAQDLDLRDESVAAVVVHAKGLQHLAVRVHGVHVPANTVNTAISSERPHEQVGFAGRGHCPVAGVPRRDDRPDATYAWTTSIRTIAFSESQLAQDWFWPYCTGPYFQ